MQLVFTLTAGRTGTRSLAGLLSANVPGAHVHHEQLVAGPRLVHTPSVPLLLEFNNVGSSRPIERFWADKAADILARPAHTWVETSHLLMKAGLVENLDRFAGHTVHLVALRRSRASLLRSYLRLGDFQRLGNRQLWYLDELGRKNLLALPPAWGQSSMGLALWYLLEVECRVALYQRLLADRAGVVLHELPVAELSGGPSAERLLAALRPPDAPPPVYPEPHNAGPKRVLSAETEARATQLLAQAADFDPHAHIDRLLQRRPRPFGGVRPLGHLAAPEPDAPIDRFIGGSGRSGTTALVDLLGCHAHLSAVYETPFLPQLVRAFADRRATPEALARDVARLVAFWAADLPQPPHGKRAHEGYLHGPHHVLLAPQVALRAAETLGGALLSGADRWTALRAFTRALFAHQAALERKPHWVNKTPDNITVLPRLLGLFPRSRVVLVVRDPRDVALSVLSRAWGPRTMDEVPEWWRSMMTPALMLAPIYPDRVRFIRYEDLVCSPAATLTQVLEFFAVDPDPGPLLDRWRGAGLSLDPSRLGRWRDRFSAADRVLFHRELEGELDTFGYGPTL